MAVSPYTGPPMTLCTLLSSLITAEYMRPPFSPKDDAMGDVDMCDMIVRAHHAKHIRFQLQLPSILDIIISKNLVSGYQVYAFYNTANTVARKRIQMRYKPVRRHVWR